MGISALFARTERVSEPEAMDGSADAYVYDQVARAHEFLDRKFVRDLLSRCARPGLVLDVGCGSGIVPALLAEKAVDVQVTGLDVSGAMLRLARDNAGGDGGGNPRFLRGDGKALPFAGGTFDAVISHHTLHHLPDPAVMLREMQRVLRVDGALFVRDLRRPDHAGVIDLYLATAGHIYDGLGSEAAMGKRQYRESLGAALSRSEWRELAEQCGIPRCCVSTLWLVNHQDIRWRKAVS